MLGGLGLSLGELDTKPSTHYHHHPTLPHNNLPNHRVAQEGFIVGNVVLLGGCEGQVYGDLRGPTVWVE